MEQLNPISSAKSLRVWFINQHYKPDVAPTGQYLSDLAEFLHKQGHEIHVFCSAGIYSEFEAGSAHSDFQGVNVHQVIRLNAFRNSWVMRSLVYVAFYLAVFIRGLFNSSPDVIVTLTTPPFISWIGRLLSWIKGARFVLWSMDMHPEAEAAVGILAEKGFLYKILYYINRRVLLSSSKIICLGHSMEANYRRQYAGLEESLSNIPIWVRNSSFPEKALIQPVINYSGNLGLVHEIDTFKGVIKLASKSADHLKFRFSGAGARRKELESWVISEGFTNVNFQPYVSDQKLELFETESLVNWFSLLPGCSGIAFPSKFISYLRSGRPCIFIGDPKSDIAAHISSAHCGRVFEPGDLQNVLDYILHLYNNSEVAAGLGRNGQEYCKSEFSLKTNLQKWLEALSLH